MPKRTSDSIRFATPVGTRNAYRQVAALEGVQLNEWLREAIRKVAIEVIESHGAEIKLPAVHRPKPKRLQPRIKIRQSLLDQRSKE